MSLGSVTFSDQQNTSCFIYDVVQVEYKVAREVPYNRHLITDIGTKACMGSANIHVALDKSSYFNQ